MKKLVIFRTFAREATKNSHVAIKACWTILFTGGTLALLRSFDELVQCKFPLLKSGLVDVRCAHVPDDFSFWLSISLFAVYILTFYRFYVGNIRVFDIRYDEVFKFIDSLHVEKNRQGGAHGDLEQEEQDYHNLLNYSDSLTKRESIYLIIQTFIIVYLTVTPSNPLKFLWVYLSLLTTDIIWIVWNFRRIQTREKYRKYLSSRFFEVFQELINTGFDRMFPENASRKWRINNAIFAFIILVVLLTHLAISNSGCIFDFGVFEDWDFYNPKFGQAQDIVIEEDRKSRP
jgi:hypothetical protein